MADLTDSSNITRLVKKEIKPDEIYNLEGAQSSCCGEL